MKNKMIFLNQEQNDLLKKKGNIIKKMLLRIAKGGKSIQAGEKHNFFIQ